MKGNVMKRLFTSLTLLGLLLPLGACATVGAFLDPNGQSVIVGGQSVIASTGNPIGPEQMLVIETAYRTAVQSGVTYRTKCYSAPIAQLPTYCLNRRQVIRIYQSAYTRAQPIMIDLRRFVKENDQVSAKSVLVAAGQAINDMQAAVAKYGAGQ